MNKILLINRLNPDDTSDEKHRIFFYDWRNEEPKNWR